VEAASPARERTHLPAITIVGARSRSLPSEGCPSALGQSMLCMLSSGTQDAPDCSCQAPPNPFFECQSPIHPQLPASTASGTRAASATAPRRPRLRRATGGCCRLRIPRIQRPAAS
jgi:hypothetical protein